MGAVSKVVASTATYPMQVLKTRIQQRAKHGQDAERLYVRVIESTRITLEREGVRGLFRGLAANLYRTVPASAITFVGYEKAVQWLKRWNAREVVVTPGAVCGVRIPHLSHSCADDLPEVAKDLAGTRCLVASSMQ